MNPRFQLMIFMNQSLKKLYSSVSYVHISPSNLTTKLAWSTKMIIARCILKWSVCIPQGGKTLLNVCVTRWVENIDGWERFSQYHPFLIEM